MSRINLIIPEKAIYHHQFLVRIDDINYGGHMGNDSVLKYAHETRLRYLKSIGASEINLLGGSLIMADAVVLFKSEAFHGDLIDGFLFYSNITSYGFDLIYLYKRDDIEIARVKTGLIFYNYTLKKISKAPAGIETLFKSVVS